MYIARNPLSPASDQSSPRNYMENMMGPSPAAATGGSQRFTYSTLGANQRDNVPNNNALSSEGRISIGQSERLEHSSRVLGSERSQAQVMGGAVIRSAAIARHWLGVSRRNALKEKVKSQRSINQSPENIPLNGQPIDENSVTLQDYNTVEALKSIVFGKSVSVLLLLIPLAFCSHYLNWGANYVFWFNFCVMIPLAAILGDFTEEVAMHTNETIGGLVNATFGNAVEVVVGVQALLANEIRVVQASMLGSIFSNLLLVLGCCFFFGGLKFKEQSFNSEAATANMGLLALSSIAMVLPTPFASYYVVEDEHVLTISRLTAVFLLLMYLQLLFFQLHTHKDIFDEGGATKAPASVPENEELDETDDDEEDEQASVSMKVALIGLLITTLSVAVFSDLLVGSIDEFCNSSGISRTFVGIIILPIVGNAVEHITAVTVAMKNKMDLAMGVAVGSCTQISLFVVPLTVLVGWITEKPMTLNFPHFEITLYILSLFTVSVCLSNGVGNWLEGSLLITTYVLIATGFWFENVVNFR